jgi:hypothetical protein
LFKLFILILGRFAKAKLLRMSYTERNSIIKFANLFRFGIKKNLMMNEIILIRGRLGYRVNSELRTQNPEPRTSSGI